ncbi:MAG: methyltransferase domain-containing protein [Anaerolineales bacterium]
MRLPLELAHRRYVQQSGWTEPMRRHLFRRAHLHTALRVLEVGCGTGAVLGNIAVSSDTRLFGLDIDLAALRFAQQQYETIKLAGGDANRLPYQDSAFDIVFYHYVLLWLQEPISALLEARRVTRAGGAVLAFAEPDYSQRVDEPASLAELGKLQTEALRAQGADPELGGRLAGLFQAAGFTMVESGQLEPSIEHDKNEASALLEWETLRADVQGRLSDKELDRLAKEDRRTRRSGERILHVPTYYAWAAVKQS